jgi:hypothetical protein
MISVWSPAWELTSETGTTMSKPLKIQPQLARSFAMVLLAGGLSLNTGCSLLKAPQEMVTAVVPVGRSSQPDPLDVQLQVQRYTDEYLQRTGPALDEYARQVGTESARVETLQLKLIGMSALVSIVSGPNPTVNLLDLVSVTVLTRRTIEDYWMGTTNGAAFRPWLEASRLMETNIWLIAARVLPAAQVEELNQGINQWYAQNSGLRTAFLARPQEFGSMVRTSQEKGAKMNSVFSLVSLDPTAGLDPAVREVTRTRLFAERAMFTMQRMPFLVRMQAELLTHEFTRDPAVQLALTNTTRLSDSADRFSRAAESVSRTAAELPDRISAERREILTALDQHEGKLKELAAEVDFTLESGERMSTSLNATITTFDALMKRFGVGEPSRNTIPGTNTPPFNILDYGQVAEQVGAMSKDLNSLVTSVNQTMPQVERLSQTAAGDAGKLVDHVFRLALILIAVLLIGAVVAGLAYRFLAGKITPPEPVSSPPAERSERPGK